MDEEKVNSNNRKTKPSDLLKKLNRKQGLFRKKINKIKLYALLGCIAGFIAIIIICSFADFLNLLGSKTSKEASSSAVKNNVTGTSEGQEDSRGVIIVDKANLTDDGAYELKYKFKDENGKTLTEKQALEQIKSDLLDEKEDIDISAFTESELKVIGTLMYNGLLVEEYTEEELQALALFQKVDIASQCFDFRTEDDEKQLTLEELRKSDEIYGTLKLYKTKVVKNDDGKAVYQQEKMEYVPYTQYEGMISSKNSEILNKFSIDEDGNLIIARMSKSSTTYKYLDEDKKELSQETKNKIPDEYKYEDTNNTYVTAYSPIEYKNKISAYTMDYGFLSDLLIVTQNVDFCMDIAENALNSKIVINVMEESTIRDIESSQEVTVKIGEKNLKDLKDSNNNTMKPIYYEDGNVVSNEVNELVKVEKLTVTIKSTTHSESYKCNVEISEIDCWYAKYKKEYEAPTIKNENSATKYEFGEEKADTTEVHLKNVKYVDNKKMYTPVDEEGNAENGFLSIYDKYISNGIDLYLQDDLENELFEMLEADETTASKSEIMKELLYIYDGIDRGGTGIKLTIKDLNNYSLITGTSTENFIKAWENGTLWLYETGQSDNFPVGYLSDDEQYYIVYEDGSSGHNNISYGLSTFISSGNTEYNEDWGYGYYNWKNEFAIEGILVEGLYEGAYVDKEIADTIFKQVLKDDFIDEVDNYLKNNLEKYNFTRAQKDALVAVKYQRGNLGNFADAYINSLNEDGTVDPEKIKEKFVVNDTHVFNYTSTVGDRMYANWLLFTKGIYTDGAGNVLKLGGASIVDVAYEVADHFLNSGVDVHYAGAHLTGESNNGINLTGLSIQDSWDLPLENPNNYGIVCATYVALVIWKAGLIDEETINKPENYFHGLYGLTNLLSESDYANEWEKIECFEDLEAGDIAFMEGHVYIYLGDGLCIDQNYCVITATGKDYRRSLINAYGRNKNYMTLFKYGYRYIG